MPEPRAVLADLVGGSLPPGLASLGDDDLAVLADAIAAAESHQAEALAKAVDHGLSFIPRVLRGTVRKALFG